MTSVNVQQNNLYGQTSIENEHVDNNLAVRDMLVSRGIFPEQFPAGEDIKKVEKRLKKDAKKLTIPRRKGSRQLPRCCSNLEQIYSFFDHRCFVKKSDICTGY